MTQSRFFQVSLSFPFVVWLLALLAASIVDRQGSYLNVHTLLNSSRVFLPYFIFAAAVWKLTDNRPYRVLTLAAMIIPLVWGVLFSLFYMIHIYFTAGYIDWFVTAVMAFWAAVVAYLFEALPWLILIVFRNDFRTGGGQSG